MEIGTEGWNLTLRCLEKLLHKRIVTRRFAPFLFIRMVSSQKLGVEKIDHSDESRPEAPSFPSDQRFQTTLPRIIEKILFLLYFSSFSFRIAAGFWLVHRDIRT